MDILIKKKTNKFVIPETVNFTELVKNSNKILSLNCESKMINLLNQEFTEQESQWYITNLYIYLNYHPTNDYPINLENVYKMLGFANKGNAMKTIKSNFTKDEDYKTLLFPTEKQKDTEETRGGHNREDIMLNVDTFKNLCMIAKTDKGKEIRRYYVKLENIHNKIIKEEIEHKDILLQENSKLLEENKNELQAKELLIKKKDKELKQLAKKVSLDWLYIATSNGINDISKIGIAEEILDRIDNHLSSNPGFKYVFTYQSKNNKVIEKCIKAILDPFLTNKKEWFNIDSKDLIYIVEFFIDLFDKNNGSEDPKMIIDYIQRLRSKNIIEKNSNEYIPNIIYDDFFQENIDTISDRMYRGKPIQPKLSFLELETKLEKWIIYKNFKIQIRNNSSNNFLEKYKNDIKRYVKETYNLDLKTIHINDIKKNIAIGGNLGYIGIKFKNTENDNFFTNDIYDNYCKNNIILSEKSKITIKELLINFNNWLNTQKIEKPINLITKGGQFSYLFKQEFRIMIEHYTKITHTKKLNTLGYTGYPGFIGIKINI